MALKIPANQIKNLQQIEVVVSGPDEANRLIIIDGQFDTGNIAADSLNRTNKPLVYCSVQSLRTDSSFENSDLRQYDVQHLGCGR
jgi:hypothetical protein